MLNVTVLQQQLRENTADLHRLLDSQPTLRQLLSPDLNRLTYQQALLGLLKPHAFLEARVMSTLATASFSYAYLPRTQALLQDLEYLGCETDNPLFDNIEQTLSLPELVAYLYLLEGSKLGSQQIVKIIQRRGLDLPVTFFHEFESQSWPLFWQFAQQELKTQQQLTSACDYARRAFQFYIAYVAEGRFQPDLLLTRWVNRSDAGMHQH